MWPFPKKVCGTCKHWQYPGEDDPRIPEEMYPKGMTTYPEYFQMSPTERNALQSSVKLCKSPRLVFYARPAEGEAALCDHEYYGASLYPTATFGCTNWEKL